VVERPAVVPIFDGEKEAKLIELACSKPPQGYARWSLRLLEDKVVELARAVIIRPLGLNNQTLRRAASASEMRPGPDIHPGRRHDLGRMPPL
jgi:hypothetical protein